MPLKNLNHCTVDRGEFHFFPVISTSLPILRHLLQPFSLSPPSPPPSPQFPGCLICSLGLSLSIWSPLSLPMRPSKRPSIPPISPSIPIIFLSLVLLGPFPLIWEWWRTESYGRLCGSTLRSKTHIGTHTLVHLHAHTHTCTALCRPATIALQTIQPHWCIQAVSGAVTVSPVDTLSTILLT